MIKSISVNIMKTHKRDERLMELVQLFRRGNFMLNQCLHSAASYKLSFPSTGSTHYTQWLQKFQAMY